MKNYVLKPSQSTSYVFMFFGILFLIAAIGTLYVLRFIVPPSSNLPKSTYSVVVLFLAIAGFSLYKAKNQNQLAKIKLDEESITNLKTNKTILWKDISDLYFFSSGKVIGLANNLAYRIEEDLPFTSISAEQYSRKDLETIEALHLNPRVKEVLQNIRNDKNVKFFFIPQSNMIKQALNVSSAQFLDIKTDEILIKSQSLTYKNENYPLSDLSVIDISQSGKYLLKTKSGIEILSFDKLSLMSCEVFRNVINELVK